MLAARFIASSARFTKLRCSPKPIPSSRRGLPPALVFNQRLPAGSSPPLNDADRLSHALTFLTNWHRKLHAVSLPDNLILSEVAHETGYQYQRQWCRSHGGSRAAFAAGALFARRA